MLSSRTRPAQRHGHPYVGIVQGNLRRAAQELSGQPADLVRKRMT
ncbi:hypothetical protein ACIP6I_28910 [Streptomyces anulatus]|nr:hypothetical protein [Streptomyces anulatus]